MANNVTKNKVQHIVIHLENINVLGKIGIFLLRLCGLYNRGYRNAQDIRVHEHDISFKNLPEEFDGYRLTVLSDLHIDGAPYPLTRTRELLKGISTDACLFLGDYREKLVGSHEMAMNMMQELVSIINVKDGIFGIRGNHDNHSMIQDLKKMGINMLVNESLEIKRNGQSLWFVGVDDPHFYENDDLEKAIENIPQERFMILMAHSPEVHWKASKCDTDLYLCGHTHGGQITLKNSGPIIVNARDSRPYAKGFWKYEGMTGYTTHGVGTSSMPIRFNCPPEIVIFTLKKRP